MSKWIKNTGTPPEGNPLVWVRWSDGDVSKMAVNAVGFPWKIPMSSIAHITHYCLAAEQEAPEFEVRKWMVDDEGSMRGDAFTVQPEGMRSGDAAVSVWYHSELTDVQREALAQVCADWLNKEVPL